VHPSLRSGQRPIRHFVRDGVSRGETPRLAPRGDKKGARCDKKGIGAAKKARGTAGGLAQIFKTASKNPLDFFLNIN
jgi:hypothetical protein